MFIKLNCIGLPAGHLRRYADLNCLWCFLVAEVKMKILRMGRCCFCLGPSTTATIIRGWGQRVGMTGLKVTRNIRTKNAFLQDRNKDELITESGFVRSCSSDKLAFGQICSAKLQGNARFNQKRTVSSLHTFSRYAVLNDKNTTRTIALRPRNFNTLPQNANFPDDKEIEDHLKRNRVPFKNGYTSIIAPCPACKSLDRSDAQRKDGKNWNLFINKTTGRFICKKCAHSGSWNEIKVPFT